MLDLTSNRNKIVDAALRLAASDGWAGLSLDRIAREAGIGLAEFRKEFSSKADILAAFTRAVDDAVLAKIGPAEASFAPRDRLFDVLMTRFEAMAPYKAGLKRICETMHRSLGDSVTHAEGSRGAIRVPGLIALYARVFDIWLEDDDPGLARTMAALDSRLRRGERAMQRLDDFGAAVERLFASFSPRQRRRAETREPPPAETPPTPAMPDGGHSNGSAGPAPAV
jgi:ubiquinone biosynthesis protein COQ9